MVLKILRNIKLCETPVSSTVCEGMCVLCTNLLIDEAHQFSSFGQKYCISRAYIDLGLFSFLEWRGIGEYSIDLPVNALCSPVRVQWS